MSPIRDTKKVRAIDFHSRARDVIRSLSKPVRRELGEALLKLQEGMLLGLPLSRPMSIIAHGAHELRIADENGTHRIFYYLKSERGILVFHAFTRKTQKTPPTEIFLGQRRLKEMLSQ